MVEKEIHTFEHNADEHCTANEKHFHDLEHHCDICDFTITDSNESTDVCYQFLLAINSFSFQRHIESVNTLISFQNLPSRAPPIV